MMDSQNRLLIAVVLSVLILLAYQKFYAAPRLQKTQQQRAGEAEKNRIITVSPPISPALPAEETREQREQTERLRRNIAISEDITILENEVFKIELTDDGARIKKIWLKKFKDSKTNKLVQLLDTKITEEIYTGPFLLEDLFLEEGRPLQRWKLIDKADKYAKYSFKSPVGILITKEIFLHNSNYNIGLRIGIKNDAVTATPVKYKLVGASALLVKPGIDERFIGADVKIGQEIKRLNPRSKALRGNGKIYYDSPLWISARGRYFSIVLEPKQKEQACFIEKEDKKSARSGVIMGPITIMPQDTVAKEFLLYAGPNDIDGIKKSAPNMSEVVTFGKLSPISLILLKILKFFNGIVHNYGLAIIMLTLLVNGVLFPLTKKSLKSMKGMQAIQPELKKLQSEHKGNPQKLQKETMGLYKKHKINPLGGCLPMFFQFPVFISLYLVLMKSIELKGANFLWIKDLSEPDAAFRLPGALPFIGEYIHVLPLLMAFAMFLQQKIAQPKATQTDQQKMMAIMFPLMFGIICYRLSSGIVLYWLTNTILMVILQEFVLKVRHMPPKSA